MDKAQEKGPAWEQEQKLREEIFAGLATLTGAEMVEFIDRLAELGLLPTKELFKRLTDDDT